jgi:hypothetical protein
MKIIDDFIDNLASQKKLYNATNLYHSNKNESIVRRYNLRQYLYTMKKRSPSIMLIGEAPGYKGCRLTGIPFSSEYILKENPFFKANNYKLIEKNRTLRKESSATIVWRELEKYNHIPLIWNIFPFHPYKPGRPNDSNRTPIVSELELGRKFLLELIDIYYIKTFAAIGRKAQSQLDALGIPNDYIRHPANRGQEQFIKNLQNVMEKHKPG